MAQERERTLTTSLGPTTFAMPRARLVTATGMTEEWPSELVPRYQRRSAQVDEAMLGIYLSGTNTRRIKGALAPLLRGGPLSKDAAATSSRSARVSTKNSGVITLR